MLYNQAVQNRYVEKSSSLLGDGNSLMGSGSAFGAVIDGLLGLVAIIAVFVFAALLVYVFLSFIYTLIHIRLARKSEGVKGASDTFGENVRRQMSFFNNILAVLGKLWGFLGKILKKKWVVALLVIFLVILPTVAKFRLVDIVRVRAGQTAIDMKSGTQLSNGYHIISPLFSDYILVHVANYDFEITNINADSKEPQDVLLHLNAVFHLDQDELFDFFNKQGVITIWDTANSIVRPRIIEGVKKVVKNYSYREVLKEQSEIKDESMKEINDSLKSLGIKLVDLNFVNIMVPRAYVKTIQEKELITERLGIETEKLEEAKLITERELEIANRNKQMQIIEAQGESEANRLINRQGISDGAIRLKEIEKEIMAIDKWNGELPENVGGDFSFSEIR